MKKIISLMVITAIGLLMTYCSDSTTTNVEEKNEYNTTDRLEHKAETAKDSLESKLRTGIVAINQKIEILDEKMEYAGDNIDARTAASKVKLEDYKHNLETQLEKIKNSTENNWQEVKTNTNIVWDDFTLKMKELEANAQDLFTKKQ